MVLDWLACVCIYISAGWALIDFLRTRRAIKEWEAASARSAQAFADLMASAPLASPIQLEHRMEQTEAAQREHAKLSEELMARLQSKK